ncbi:MAG: energy transducer TonB [Deltaproteobacteria bacterium]|nr:energy transducer TonB [Deltaproteobacteria bacterium]
MRSTNGFAWVWRMAVAALVVGGVACGGSEATRRTSARSDRLIVPRADEERTDGTQFEGILGQIDPAEARAALERRMGSFMRCYSQRLSSVEYLGGNVELTVRIGTEGSVRWAFVSQSTMGDLPTETCLLGVAQGASFPRPRGGEAEFRYPLEFEPGDGVRPPLSWSHDRVASVIGEHRGDLASCSLGGSSVSVTAYVEPGGRVAAAGVASSARAAANAAECVVQAVSGWTFPDPGSYAAKVTFTVD